MALNGTIEKAKEMGNLKVAGEHSLTAGEIVAIVIAAIILLYGEKVPFVKGLSVRMRTVVALLVVFVAEWVW